PSDSQMHDMNNVVQHIKEDICGMDAEMAWLKHSIDQLIAQRAELQCFVDNHRGAISIVRRLPSVVLSEIFLRCADQASFCYPPHSNITQVCSRWRAVALASP
ncbi:hypothetical protein B0H19DRAFT_915548, partial [Mycena capillaripes]